MNINPDINLVLWIIGAGTIVFVLGLFVYAICCHLFDLAFNRRLRSIINRLEKTSNEPFLKPEDGVTLRLLANVLDLER